MTITHEVLPSMKLIKYYAWESFMEARIQGMRNLEQRLLAKSAMLKGVNICLVFTVPPICAWMIFTGYEYEVERLSSSLAFVTLTLFNVLRFPLIVLPKALRALSGGPQWLASMLQA